MRHEGISMGCHRSGVTSSMNQPRGASSLKPPLVQDTALPDPQNRVNPINQQNAMQFVPVAD